MERGGLRDVRALSRHARVAGRQSGRQRAASSVHPRTEKGAGCPISPGAESRHPAGGLFSTGFRGAELLRDPVSGAPGSHQSMARRFVDTRPPSLPEKGRSPPLSVAVRGRAPSGRRDPTPSISVHANPQVSCGPAKAPRPAPPGTPRRPAPRRPASSTAPGGALLPRPANAPPLAPAGGRGYGTAFRGRVPPHPGGRPPALRAWR